MRPGGKATDSRKGKKQVIAFLLTHQAQAAYAKAGREDKTNQEVIGEAVNAVFAFYGMPPPVPEAHSRTARRTWGRAAPRGGAAVPSCRAGRVSYGGWFDEAIVVKLHRLASEFGVSAQSVIEHGLELVTGVGASAPAWDEASAEDLPDAGAPGSAAVSGS